MQKIFGLAITLLALSKNASSEGTRVCKTNGGSEANQNCVFPFTYKNVEYEQCTYFGDYSQPWCATETNAQGDYVSKKWGFCEPGCPAEERPCAILYDGQNYSGKSVSIPVVKQDAPIEKIAEGWDNRVSSYRIKPNCDLWVHINVTGGWRSMRTGKSRSHLDTTFDNEISRLWCKCDQCQPNPCQNGGTCATSGDEFKCECPPEFEGPTCGKKASPIDVQDCYWGEWGEWTECDGTTCHKDQMTRTRSKVEGNKGLSCEDLEGSPIETKGKPCALVYDRQDFRGNSLKIPVLTDITDIKDVSDQWDNRIRSIKLFKGCWIYANIQRGHLDGFGLAVSAKKLAGHRDKNISVVKCECNVDEWAG